VEWADVHPDGEVNGYRDLDIIETLGMRCPKCNKDIEEFLSF